MPTFEELLRDAEEKGSPDSTVKPQEEADRKVPEHVDIEEHRTEGEV